MAYRPAPPATAFSSATRTCLVVGGGNTAVEEALYLANITEPVDELRIVGPAGGNVSRDRRRP